MTPDGKPRKRQSGDRHATAEPTEDDARMSADQNRSHREVAALVREADRFAIQLPVVGHVPIPRPDQLVFYGTLGVLVAVELVDWPVALAIGAAHALFSDPPNRQISPEAAHAPE
jgi:hypothetical protein